MMKTLVIFALILFVANSSRKYFKSRLLKQKRQSNRQLLVTITDHPENSIVCWLDYEDYYKRQEINGKFIRIQPFVEYSIPGITRTMKRTEWKTARIDHKCLCLLELHYTSYPLYQELHQSLSENFPTESERPVIQLEIRNLNHDGKYKYGVGIIGGVGQLADAEVLMRLMGIIKTNWDRQILSNMVLKIHSNPPPRSMTDVTGLYRYKTQVGTFLNDFEVRTFLLASNTAHINYLELQTLFATVSTPFHGVRNYINVIEETVNIIKYGPYSKGVRLLTGKHVTDPLEFKILIVGTLQAWSAQLYSKALQAVHLKPLRVTNKQQTNIQGAIDFIKKNNLAKGKEIIMKEISDNIKSVTHVLMGCSELSLAVTEEDVISVNPNVLYVDTTQLMAEYIASTLRGNQLKQDSIDKFINRHNRNRN